MQAPLYLILIGAIVAVVALAGAIVSAYWARRSWPIGMQEVAKQLDERVRAAEAIVEGHAAKIRELRAEYAAFEEEALGVLEAVERKRRRAAASASKVTEHEQNAEPPPGSPERRAYLRQLARSRGINV